MTVHFHSLAFLSRLLADHGILGPRMSKKTKIKVQDLELRSVKTGALIATGAVIDNGRTVTDKGKVNF